MMLLGVTLSTRSSIAAPYCLAAARGLATQIVIPPNAPAQAPAHANPDNFAKTPEQKRLWNRTGEVPQYKLGKHRSNALQLVHKIPPIEVDGDMAICDGGGGALGHPIEYISIERPGAVEYCKYCALRFTKKKKA